VCVRVSKKSFGDYGFEKLSLFEFEVQTKTLILLSLGFFSYSHHGGKFLTSYLLTHTKNFQDLKIRNAGVTK
jgi:hypothetical protein